MLLLFILRFDLKDCTICCGPAFIPVDNSTDDSEWRDHSSLQNRILDVFLIDCSQHLSVNTIVDILHQPAISIENIIDAFVEIGLLKQDDDSQYFIPPELTFLIPNLNGRYLNRDIALWYLHHLQNDVEELEKQYRMLRSNSNNESQSSCESLMGCKLRTIYSSPSFVDKIVFYFRTPSNAMIESYSHIGRHCVKVSSSDDVIECTLLKRPNTKISTYTTNSDPGFGK